MDPKVVIVILNWNRASDTIECVDSIQNLAYPNFEIVVVDNASTDGSVVALEKKFPELKIIRNSRNLGYTGGNNIGIRYALDHVADHVLLLNNDTIVDKDLVHDLVSAMQRQPQAGIVSPTIYDYQEPAKVWFAGASIDWDSGESPHWGLGEQDHGQFNRVVEVDRVSGCAMLVRRAVFDRIGLLDPDYFLYYEDVDFCVRAFKAGYKSYCVQTAKVWHKVSSSTQANRGSDLHAYYHARNRLLFLRKHGRIAESVHRENRAFFRKYVSGVVRRPFDRAYRRQYAPRFWALADFYLGRYGIKSKYHGGVGARGA